MRACSRDKSVGGTSSPDIIAVRTGYPYQTLQLVPENAELPAFSLWVAYMPEDAEQRTSHVYGLLMIEKPPIPGALHLGWPLIGPFTEGVFAEDRMAVEAEQRAWDEQGEDRNHEVFPLIIDVRQVLRANGVPLRPESALAAAPRSAATRRWLARHRMPNRTPDTSGRLDEPPVTEGPAWTVKKLLDSRTRHASRRHLCGIQLVHVLFKDSAERESMSAQW